METNKFDVGQKVRVRQRDGKVITAIIEDIGEKDGRVVYDLDNGHWCYKDQIIKVIN